MSTAFLVDNILNDKEDRTESLSSDTESDTASDLKDSICGSPEMTEMHHHHHHHFHHLDQSSSPTGEENNSSPQHRINQFSKTFLRTYNTMVMRNNNINNATADNLSDNNFIEMCCAKCGHFQQQQLVKRLDINHHHHHISTTSVAYDDNTDIEIDFKCDKCDSNEGVKTSTMTTPVTAQTIPATNKIDETTTTILKDSAKPILKFSVSAILSDKKEYAKVRNGKHTIRNNEYL